MKISKHTELTTLTKQEVRDLLPCFRDQANNEFFIDGISGKIYGIGNTGEVYEIKGTDEVNGYYRVTIKTLDGYSCINAHRFIYSVYFNLPDLLKSQPIHHINGKKTDNRIDNLLWCENQAVHKGIHFIEKRYVKNKEMFYKYLSNTASNGVIFDSNDLVRLKNLVFADMFK